MNINILNDFVTQIHDLVTIPAFSGSMGFLGSAVRGNTKFSQYKAAGDLYLSSSLQEQQSMNAFVYHAIHYACFSLLQFLEEYGDQSEMNEGKILQLVLMDSSDHSETVELFSEAGNQLRTMFRRIINSDEKKDVLAKLFAESAI
jgi:hypothetical protein